MEGNNHNSIYAYTFSGVVLLIATIVCIVINMGNILALQPAVVIAALALGSSALFLLYTAIKLDGYRMKDM